MYRKFFVQILIAKYFEQGKELKLQFLDFHALLA